MSIPIVTIGSISEQIRGVSYSKTDASDIRLEGYLPILRAGNITESGLTFDDLVFVPSGKISNTQKIKKNDILIAASSGSLSVVGKAARALDDFNGGFGAFCKVLRPNAKVDPAYFANYFFTSEYRRKISSVAAGANINNLRNSDIDDLEIPLPPLAEQKRLAAILDKADAIRRKRQQAIELADEFLRSVFLDMFGDPVTNPKDFPVGTIRDLVDSVNYGTSSKASEIDGAYPILRMGNITYNGDWDFTSLKYIDLAEKEKAKYLVSKGDLLFNRTNSKELVGKTAVYEEDKPMAIAGYLIRVRPNSDGNNHYISGYLNSMHGKEILMAMCKNIVGMANINAQELQDIKILIPPKKYQDQYANIVIATKSKVKKLKQALAEADILFKALSQRAFAGEL